MFLFNLLINLIYDAVQLLTILIVVRAVLSWVPSVDYRHPLIRIIMTTTDPVLEPIRRVLPPVGGFDLSPLVAILLLQLITRNLLPALVARVTGA